MLVPKKARKTYDRSEVTPHIWLLSCVDDLRNSLPPYPAVRISQLSRHVPVKGPRCHQPRMLLAGTEYRVELC